MKVLLFNSSWYDANDSMKWGVRAGSRWPHMQQRAATAELPRYIPFPFFMATAAAVLRQTGYEVKILDAIAEDMNLEESYEIITDFNPDVIFSESSTPSLNWDKQVFATLHEKFPEAIIVSGGSQGVSMVPEIMQGSAIPHYWLGGEFDLSLLQLVEALEGKGELEKVPGLITREFTNPPAVVENVLELPSPLYEDLPVKSYSDPVCGLPAPVAQVWLSRGCPYKCTFCVWPQVVFGNNKYRTRSIDDALDDIEKLINVHGCESFYFDDDTTNVGPKRMIELAEGIKARGLDKYPWSMMARADCMNDAALEALKSAGLYSIKYGVESIAESLVDSCEKGTNLKKFRRAIEYTRELGIKLHLTFMFGIPEETEETIQETLDFAMDIAPESAQFSLCTPFPGTKFYKQCEDNGWLITKDWGRFLGSDEAVVSTPWLSADQLQKSYLEAKEKWRQFNLERLSKKRSALLTELKTKVEDENMKWTLLGDRDFAQFIWQESPSSVLEKFTEDNSQENTQKVIVSLHDEEKIFRKLQRESALEKDEIIRLFK
ncbi:MAG: radical SAM protein [Lentisphaeraceae bacterium]|nr:radical SAM protein [Lentisphaeraceae bacterium]